jgi:flagellar M-ring protein FliF
MLRLWRQLGLNQKITLGASALAILGAVAALLFWAQRPDMKLLYGRLGEKEAAEVVAALQAQKVPYELGAGGTSVYVPSNMVYKARADLASKGLPAPDGIGFEIFDRSNFGISDFVQRTNFTRALQGELSRTIAQIRGVRSARVMVVLPENRLLLKNTESRPTASVFIDTGGAAFETDKVNSVRALVASAVEGMRLDDVAVVDSRGNVLSEELKSDPQLGSASSQIKFRKQTEEYFSNKVETMLARVLGPGQAVVRVSAEINNDASSVTEEKFDPESQVARSETSTEDTSITNEREAEKAGGAGAGVAANLPPDPNAAGGGGPSKTSEDQRKSKTQTYEINRQVISTVKNPGAVTRITAAVFLSTRPGAAGAAPVARTAEELNSLKQMVVNALGISSSNAQAQNAVSIQEVPFPAAVEAAGTATDKFAGYLETARPVGGLLLAAAFFFVFLRLLKKTKPEPLDIEVVNGGGGMYDQQGMLSMKSHKVSPELLNDLIRQKPENVGATLREWLAQNGDKS